MPTQDAPPLRIAVIGSGISGLSAAWLLSKAHEVTLYEADGRLGGHAHTVDAQTAQGSVPVDTGFIVYNEPNYPNLTALFAHLEVETTPSEMSFGVSLDNGDLEYSSAGLFAQRRNLFRPRFWTMINDLLKFQRHAAADALRWTDETSLSEYMAQKGFCRAFQEDHLLPQAAAIWSASLKDIGDYPARALLRFFDNHGLLKLNFADRPQWRTVRGGSRAYVRKLIADFRGRVLMNTPVRRVTRLADGVAVETAEGVAERYDRVVLASHADQALRMLHNPTAAERRVLGSFGYSHNRTVLHGDPSFMPSRRGAWSSWNHQGLSGIDADACITYWMNRLHDLPRHIDPLFVTLNPSRAPAVVQVDQDYEHPMFNAAAIGAQPSLPGLQGEGGIYFCGAYFGSGFHEDGLQSGLAVAEAIGGARRPWTVANASGRMPVPLAEREPTDLVAA